MIKFIKKFTWRIICAWFNLTKPSRNNEFVFAIYLIATSLLNYGYVNNFTSHILAGVFFTLAISELCLIGMETRFTYPSYKNLVALRVIECVIMIYDVLFSWMISALDSSDWVIFVIGLILLAPLTIDRSKIKYYE